MSYDLYFWYRAEGHPDDVLEDLGAIEPHPAVRAFRTEVLGKYPDLVDVCEPFEDDPDASRYLLLTLPFSWVETTAPGVLEAPRRHELTGWDPQLMEAPSPEQSSERPASSTGGLLRALGGLLAGRTSTARTWSAEEIRAVFETGPRRMSRTWKILRLGQRVGFAEAVAVESLTHLLSDLDLSPDQAREHFGRISELCHDGVPPEGTTYSVEAGTGLTITLDISGTARALASPSG